MANLDNLYVAFKHITEKLQHDIGTKALININNDIHTIQKLDSEMFPIVWKLNKISGVKILEATNDGNITLQYTGRSQTFDNVLKESTKFTGLKFNKKNNLIRLSID